MPDALPPFPLDDCTLDMLWTAIHPDPAMSERSSVDDFLDLMAALGGSDLSAVEVHEGDIVIGLHPTYHVNEVLAELIAEVRRLRIAAVAPPVAASPARPVMAAPPRRPVAEVRGMPPPRWFSAAFLALVFLAFVLVGAGLTLALQLIAWSLTPDPLLTPPGDLMGG